MPDADPSPPISAAKPDQSYPIGGSAATPSLAERLAARIAAGGPLRFVDFMAAALYDPQAGYYARAGRRIGRRGDFYTSVSVGPLFGELLARRFLADYGESGRPARWRIIETGAHDGSLAADVLQALRRLDAHAAAALDYAIVEPLAAPRAAQAANLEEFSGTVRIVDDPAALAADPLPGLAFGNELLDALPFHVVRFEGGRWHECRVDHDRSRGFFWTTAEIEDPALRTAVAGLGDRFPDGYRTEIRTGFEELLDPLRRCLIEPLMIWLDYGFIREDYYHPARCAGTLRTFHRHRAGDDPFASPGESDITAHVDFTAVAEAAARGGGVVTAFRDQGSWLTHIARDWLISLENRPDPAAIRSFQTLSHPAHLGRGFQVIELSWKPGAAPCFPALANAGFRE